MQELKMNKKLGGGKITFDMIKREIVLNYGPQLIGSL
jgi:hypothetical protein